MRLDQYTRESDDAWRITSLRGKEATLHSHLFSIDVPLAELYELVL